MSIALEKRKIVRLRPRRGANARARALREARETVAKLTLASSALFSIVVTVLIVAVLLYESSTFFAAVPLSKFLLTTTWAPQYEPPQFGIWALLSATLVTTAIALAVALPIGTVVAVFLSEFAPHAMRETIKPSLELLSAVPTIVYG